MACVRKCMCSVCCCISCRLSCVWPRSNATLVTRARTVACVQHALPASTKSRLVVSCALSAGLERTLRALTDMCDACSACVADKYKNTLGNTQCQDNPAWLVGPDQGCSYFAPARPYDGLCVPMAGTGTCSNCCDSSGHVCPGGGSGISTGLCTSCASGTYSPTQGASSCTLCATGKYSATAATTCLACHANSTSPEGSTAAASSVCDLGYQPGA
jgi:hypothetical protein